MGKSRFSYKSFCWSFGTTSFRTEEFNKTIEKQLELLNKFWALPGNESKVWNEKTQTEYFDFLLKEKFVEGEAKNKPKDAREKTSGLVDIGLIDDNRRPTEVGKLLLEICEKNDFKDDNIFLIEKDSLIYLEQLLKVSSNKINKTNVRPFIIFLKLLFELDHLTKEEFTYLMPMCVDEQSLNYIIQAIKDVRANKLTYDEVIVHYLLQMDNYKAAQQFFLSSPTITKEIICEIGMNRDSKKYDMPYYDLYINLKKVYLDKDSNAITDLLDASRVFKNKPGILWRALLFDTPNKKAIIKEPEKHLKINEFSNAKNENDFKQIFFKYLHLFKAKATLSDYQDLNYRFINTADIVLFEDSSIKLDIIPNVYFKNRINALYNDAYSATSNLVKFTTLEQINTGLAVNELQLISEINHECGTTFTNLSETKGFIQKNRYDRFNKLVDTKFTNNDLIKLLDDFEKRNDTNITSYVTKNAEVPTIFEYILAIIWYVTSDRKIDVLNSLKLDANLLPKSHAEGGRPDIFVSYESTNAYPKHDLLLEATLADNINQRRMEMEPVSRHLGNHLLDSKNQKDYCIFASTFLHPNLISDFRLRKYYHYYDSDKTTEMVGMKIITLHTSELKTILNKNIKYNTLYNLFENAYNSSLPPHEWYEKEIVDKL